MNAPAEDAYGERGAGSWQTTDTVYASIKPLRGVERLVAGGRKATVTHRMTTRYQNAPEALELVSGEYLYFLDGTVLHLVSDTKTPAQRVVYDSRTFEVVSVIDRHEGHRYMDWLIREVA